MICCAGITQASRRIPTCDTTDLVVITKLNCSLLTLRVTNANLGENATLFVPGLYYQVVQADEAIQVTPPPPPPPPPPCSLCPNTVCSRMQLFGNELLYACMLLCCSSHVCSIQHIRRCLCLEKCLQRLSSCSPVKIRFNLLSEGLHSATHSSGATSAGEGGGGGFQWPGLPERPVNVSQAQTEPPGLYFHLDWRGQLTT